MTGIGGEIDTIPVTYVKASRAHTLAVVAFLIEGAAVITLATMIFVGIEIMATGATGGLGLFALRRLHTGALFTDLADWTGGIAASAIQVIKPSVNAGAVAEDLTVPAIHGHVRVEDAISIDAPGIVGTLGGEPAVDGLKATLVVATDTQRERADDEAEA